MWNDIQKSFQTIKLNACFNILSYVSFFAVRKWVFLNFLPTYLNSYFASDSVECKPSNPDDFEC